MEVLDAEKGSLGCGVVVEACWLEVDEAVGRLLALVMAALSTCDKVGLIPHAKHGGSGVWAFAVTGSKFEGTGLEKLQMVQTQVAVVIAGGPDGGSYALSACAGDGVLPLEATPVLDTTRL